MVYKIVPKFFRWLGNWKFLKAAWIPFHLVHEHGIVCKLSSQGWILLKKMTWFAFPHRKRYVRVILIILSGFDISQSSFYRLSRGYDVRDSFWIAR